MIGEPPGGSIDPDQIPKSFILFTDEPLYTENEKFSVMRIDGGFGNGDAFVRENGISSDKILILRSEQSPDRLYLIYDNQLKPYRLAPMQTVSDGVKLVRIKNPDLLQKSPAFSRENLMEMYRFGKLMETYFNQPTDIEGIIKGNRLHFVQARPVHRKPRIFPTYLEFNGKNLGLEQMQAEVLVAGQASVITVKSPQELLVAPTLEEAERRLQMDNPPKLVIVTHQEPSNSHSVINFSSLGIRCLYLPSQEDLTAFLAKIDEDHPLAVCMQRGSLYLWDQRQEDIEDYIAQGFAVHPANFAISLPLQTDLSLPSIPNVTHTTSLPPEFEELLSRIRDDQDPLSALSQLEKHPWIKYLLTKYEAVTHLYEGRDIPGPIRERLEVLKSLASALTSAFAELRANYSHPTGRLQRLFHLKVLETLVRGNRHNGVYPVRGIGQYALCDAMSIGEAIDTLIDYTKDLFFSPHALDLLLDGKQVNQEAFSRWRQLLSSLEPLVEGGEILEQEWVAFKDLIASLKQGGALPTWLTFFQGQPDSSWLQSTKQVRLNHFRAMLLQVNESQKEMIARFNDEQQTLKIMRDQIDRFESPESFPESWKRLKEKVDLFSSPAWIESLRIASPIVRLIGYQTMAMLLDLLDTAAKTLKATHRFPNDGTQVRLFKEMLYPYLAMSRAWAEQLVPADKIPMHGSYPHPEYFDYVRNRLDEMSDFELTQFRPSKDFSVAAAIIGTKTAIDKHNPRSLEDMLTLCHQNGIVALAICNFNCNRRNNERSSVLCLELYDPSSLNFSKNGFGIKKRFQ